MLPYSRWQLALGAAVTVYAVRKLLLKVVALSTRKKTPPPAPTGAVPVYDVLSVGAGLSGICAGYHMQNDLPGKTFAILEGRSVLGGTWELFRYPGIRSDSDMFTLGFPFFPWCDPKGIADGPAILSYIQAAAKHFGIDKKIIFNMKVVRASWSDEENMWTLDISPHKDAAYRQMKCRFLIMSSGYYNYDTAFTPEFPSRAHFPGPVVHPQFWDPKLDYTDKKIVIIGSGATAITLLPELTKKAAHVTMLQRTPTYIVTAPYEDPFYRVLTKYLLLPKNFVAGFCKWKNILRGMFYYWLAKRNPLKLKTELIKRVQAELGPSFDMKHFTPPYDVWDQRVCLVPESDLFKVMKEGKASVVTDSIVKFTSKGILLSSGLELPADIIITATGLIAVCLGGAEIYVNGKKISASQTTCYRGNMYSDLPNMNALTGYTNASWTLKCDLSAQYMVRLLKHMDKNGYKSCTPRLRGVVADAGSVFSGLSFWLCAACGQRYAEVGGSKSPWKMNTNYIRDMVDIGYGSVTDSFLSTSKKKTRSSIDDFWFLSPYFLA